MLQEPDLATVAALIAEPSRASILSALMGGEALPATELAYRAQITPQTASSHLAKLLDGNLISVTTVGRHRYYALKNQSVAHVLETLQLIAAPAQNRPPRMTKISPELCHARTCYDHLAGKLGVALTSAFIEKGYLLEDEQLYSLTDKGTLWVASHEIDIEALQKKRRKFAYACLDWSERRFHLGGSLGAAITDVFFEKGWIKRLPHTRAIKITSAGDNILRQDFGIQAL
jgi:DNA-binding transcriptional ArsR family regulator